MTINPPLHRLPAVVSLLACVALPLGTLAAHGETIEPCRIKRVPREVRCGAIHAPENPDAPEGRKITVKFAVVPALAKNKAPDPIFFFAGGPGQAAMQIASQILSSQSMLNARRDLVFVDQRGTGASNKLSCAQPDRVESLAVSLDTGAHFAKLDTCLKTLTGQGNDTRQYATWIAMRDIDAVRAAIGADKINLWGGSYGTRAALEYLRQFPSRVRSVVLDGAVPPDMVLPASFAVDNDAALNRLIALCANEPACKQRHPNFGADIDRLLADATAGRLRVAATHPTTGQREKIVLDRSAVAGSLRAPLYAPMLAAGLPHAVAKAAGGDPDPLIALTMVLAGSVADNMAEVMHFAVVCAEDMPRLDDAVIAAAARTRFGNSFDNLYRRVCPNVPVRPVPPEFYSLSDTDVPVMVLSGGADPATPPRHGEAVAKSLKRAQHFVAPNLGHGVAHHGCAPELIAKFIRQGNFDKLDGACLAKLPAPTFFAAPGTN